MVYIVYDIIILYYIIFYDAGHCTEYGSWQLLLVLSCEFC